MESRKNTDHTHNASITNEDAAVPQIIDNYKRVLTGDILVNQVNVDDEY